MVSLARNNEPPIIAGDEMRLYNSNFNNLRQTPQMMSTPPFDPSFVSYSPMDNSSFDPYSFIDPYSFNYSPMSFSPYNNYNYGFPNFNNSNIVPTQARVPQAPPAGYRPGIDPEFNYFPNLNPPASTIGQYPYGITPPSTPSINFGGIGGLPGLQDLLGGINLGDTTAEGIDLSNIFQNQNMFQQPVIDYDLLASKINIPDLTQPQFEMPDFSAINERLTGIEQGLFDMPSFQMPDYSKQFEELQQGLGGLGTQFSNLQMPTFEVPDFDYNQLATNLAGQIDFPTFEMPDYSQQFQDLQSGIGNLGTQFSDFQMPTFEMPEFDYDQLAGNIAGQIQMPSFEMPDYSQQFTDLSTQLGGLSDQFGNFQMPSFEMPDYSQQFTDLQTGLGALGQQIGGIEMPSFDMPDYSQQFSDLSTQIGNIGYQGPSLQDIQGIMPSFNMPDYSQQFTDLQTGLGTLGDQIGGIGYQGPSLQDIQGIMPTFNAPDYSQQFSDIQSGLGGLSNQISGMSMPTYNQQTPNTFFGGGFGFAEGGQIRYQEGQQIAGLDSEDIMTEGNEQLLSATIMAIQGMVPDQATADAIINQFIGLYGRESFLALREQILNGDGTAQTEGMIDGFGGGMDDFVEGIAGDQNRIAASPGEYIVPADVVSQLGDGNSKEGARKLDSMLDRTRMEKTGTTEQAAPIDSRKVLPA